LGLVIVLSVGYPGAAVLATAVVVRFPKSWLSVDLYAASPLAR
jgi:hypothetical protein